MIKKSVIAVVVSFLLTLVAFQNCGSDVAFHMDEKKVVTLADDNGGPGEVVICDPFSPTSDCAAGQGLKGSLYYLQSGDTTSPRAKIDDIITYGIKTPLPILFSKFDIYPRAWETGFPSSDGVMTTSDGQKLVEWFAIDVNGSIIIQAGAETEYQFATLSDDGVIFKIDGQDVITHDGQHSPTWKCSSQKVTLTPGQTHLARLKYFQGPRNHIALRLMWRPWSMQGDACHPDAGFTPVPSSVLFH